MSHYIVHFYSDKDRAGALGLEFVGPFKTKRAAQLHAHETYPTDDWETVQTRMLPANGGFFVAAHAP